MKSSNSRTAQSAGCVACLLDIVSTMSCTKIPCMQGSSKQNDSVADVVLTGHTDIAEFAEGISNAAPLVASGGRDTNVSNDLAPGVSFARLPSAAGVCEASCVAAQVLIWNLGDHVTTLSAVGGMPSTAFPQSKLSPQITLKVVTYCRPLLSSPLSISESLVTIETRSQS